MWNCYNLDKVELSYVHVPRSCLCYYTVFKIFLNILYVAQFYVFVSFWGLRISEKYFGLNHRLSSIMLYLLKYHKNIFDISPRILKRASFGQNKIWDKNEQRVWEMRNREKLECIRMNKCPSQHCYFSILSSTNLFSKINWADKSGYFVSPFQQNAE